MMTAQAKAARVVPAVQASAMSMVVAVRSLCDFTARAGDLDRRFTPAPTALQGMAGHTVVSGRRGPHYQTEVSLAIDHEGLRVRGRADGFDPTVPRIEEIKTYRGDLDTMPGNQRTLHWAQARAYAHLLCVAHGLARIEIALVYFNVSSQTETVLVEQGEAGELATWFAQQCGRYMAWARQEQAHRLARDAGLRDAAFPKRHMRAGQRELAVAVYRGARDGYPVLAQAPTGIGKTLGTLFPALKASVDGAVDKIYFLTAKAPGRQLALDGVRQIQDSAVRAGRPVALRTLELVARDKACQYPGRACRGDECPLARGFYDRLPQARAQALGATDVMDREAVARAALTHEICPYYLSQELVRWSDVIIGDYNYYYDGSAMLYALAQTHQWRVSVLVDEAHNLVERARAMYSATLSQQALDGARRAAPQALRMPLDALHRRWQAWNRGHADAFSQTDPDEHHDALHQLPESLCQAIRQAASGMTDMVETLAGSDEAVMRFYFDAMHFVRLCDSFGPHSLFDASACGNPPQGRLRTTLAIRNVVPAPFLAPRHAGARSACLFSATLHPQHFYLDMLGLPATTAAVDVASPFRPEQLDVRIVCDISTRYRDRAASVDKVVAVVARQLGGQPGNYLAFFSSFDYLEQVRARLTVLHPGVPVWSQVPGMDEAARAGFLAAFVPGGTGVGLAVLGGSFGEGVDLAGDRLVGAFIATLGLPQMSPVNARMMQCMQARFGQGYEYTYLYPGLQKVVQAAGRVIRSESDEGVVHLIDDRYASPRVRALLPAWWRPTHAYGRLEAGK